MVSGINTEITPPASRATRRSATEDVRIAINMYQFARDITGLHPASTDWNVKRGSVNFKICYQFFILWNADPILPTHCSNDVYYN